MDNSLAMSRGTNALLYESSFSSALKLAAFGLKWVSGEGRRPGQKTYSLTRVRLMSLVTYDPDEFRTEITHGP